jgi:hypothetical protein
MPSARIISRRLAFPSSGAADSNTRTESAQPLSSSSARRWRRSCGRARIPSAAASAFPGAPVYPLRTIVGVVGDAKHFGLHLPVTAQAYVPHAQSPWRMPAMTVVVRVDAERDPLSLVPALARARRTASIDPAVTSRSE